VCSSDLYWRTRLGADPSVVGATVMLNGRACTVIGVAPRGFTSLIAGLAPDMWLPIAIAPQVMHDADLLERRDSNWLLVVGRLEPRVGEAQARVEMSSLANQLALEYPATNRGLDAELFSLTPVPGPYRGYVGAFTGVLLALATMVLVIACINVSNLLLARSVSRRQEMAIRSALGAGSGRLVRQALTEYVQLGCVGGCIGLVLAVAVSRLLLGLTPPTLPLELSIPIDWRVLGFTFVVSILAGALFGAMPALRGTTFDQNAALKDHGIGGSRRRSLMRDSLIVLQITACMALLVAGALCYRSLVAAEAIDPGFDPRNRLVASFDLQSLDYSTEQGEAFVQRLLDRVRALPGVRSASVTSHLPLQTARMELGITIDGYEPQSPEEAIVVGTADVDPQYFGAMGIPDRKSVV